MFQVQPESQLVPGLIVLVKKGVHLLGLYLAFVNDQCVMFQKRD